MYPELAKDYPPQPAFSGSFTDYAQLLTFDWRLNQSEVATALTKAVEITPSEKGVVTALFSNTTGQELFASNCMPPSAKAFEIAYWLQFHEDPANNALRLYARNFVNAIASHAYALPQIPTWETRKQNINWLLAQDTSLSYANATLEEYNDLEGLRTLGYTYRTIARHVRGHLA
ncbi:hypothetical protein M1563_03500 [Patescibacteria group bacterium]|nr:hypothetical protein [Patescibacteria group bacterium]MCL5409606.1 hypothetical protein [Patescibacteria group bacterium]